MSVKGSVARAFCPACGKRTLYNPRVGMIKCRNCNYTHIDQSLLKAETDRNSLSKTSN